MRKELRGKGTRYSGTKEYPQNVYFELEPRKVFVKELLEVDLKDIIYPK